VGRGIPINADVICGLAERLLTGVRAYQAALALRRLGDSDISTLFEATRGDDLQRRWQLLWVLCPTLSRLARTLIGRRRIAQEFDKDTAALQLVLRFADADSTIVDRFFMRMHDDLVDLLMLRFVRLASDPTRAPVVAQLIATLEFHETPLRESVARTRACIDPEALFALMPKLVRGQAKLSSSRLREVLCASRSSSGSENQ